MNKNVKTKKNTNKSKIAILAWGSTLFPANKKKLAIAGNKFNPNGPEIPLELTRISKDGHLSLVIDEEHGVGNKVFYAVSKHGDVNKAFAELVKVEKINPNRIGVVDIKRKETSEAAARHSNTTLAIANWAKKNGFDACIFSSLGRKFKDEIDIKFSPQNALKYVSELPAAKQKLALNYIKALPKSINTPVKELVQEEFD